MQVLHLGIAAATVYVFARFSPFTRFQKGLFAFGYFPFYEYSIISRDYALGVLLFFAVCALHGKRPGKLVTISIFLFLLALTQVLALILVISVCAALLTEFFLSSRSRPEKLDLILSGSLVILGIAISVVTMIPPPDSGPASGWKTAIVPRDIVRTMNLIPCAVFPVPEPKLNFWNTSVFSALPDAPVGIMVGGIMLGKEFPSMATILKFFLAVFIILYGILFLSTRPAALCLYLFATVGLCLFFYMKYDGYLRHHGFLFIAFVGSVWMAATSYRLERPWQLIRILSQKCERMVHPWLTVIFLVHFGAGVFAMCTDWAQVFSQGRAAAYFIRNAGLSDWIIVGDDDVSTSTVSGFLGRQIYYPRGYRYGSFTLFNRLRGPVPSQNQIVRRAKELRSMAGKDYLLVTSYPLSKRICVNNKLVEIARFEHAIEEKENYYLYVEGRRSPVHQFRSCGG